MKPISPSDVLDEKLSQIPDVVIEVFNSLIAENYSCGRSDVLLADVVARLGYHTGLSQDELVDKGWLDIEPLYRRKGWRVEFDKPGYNETYGAKYVFRGPDR